MANITTYRAFEPWTGWSGLESPIDELIRGFFVRPLALDSRGLSEPSVLRVDVTENEKEYRVMAEMPGVRKEDIGVSINGNEVAISAEVKKEREAQDGEQTLKSERYYGKLHRAFTLEHAVDEAKAQARYVDGVLELVLPKSEAARPKRIAVH